MSTETELAAIQEVIEDHGGIKRYEVDGVEVEQSSLDELTRREDALLARRNRNANGMLSRVNFSGGIT